jgi:acyl-CoA synthetase (AMP-forming)/AMP-acid ligase II
MFWNLENTAPDLPAVIDDVSGRTFSYSEIKSKCVKINPFINFGSKKLIFSFCDNSVESIIIYLSALRSGNAVFLVNTKMDSGLKQSLINIYKPEIIFSVDDITEFLNDSFIRAHGYDKVEIDEKYSIHLSKNHLDSTPPHPDLAVLLSTSGTTGSPKLVKLTFGNIQSNAEAISQYLDITGDETPITSLPMHYSFGLSVINSHLLKGAKIVCTNKSMVMREFWNTFNRYNCTSFSGVPYNYQMLQRLKFDKMDLPSLKTMTQAGGRLSEEFIKYFYEITVKKGIRFFVMYGQTEATARISYVPYEKLGDKIGSIGVPIPNGRIKIFSDENEITSPSVQGELVYYGKNVMMGYAERKDDLSKDDELHGILHTGDLAYKDDEGFYYITGRLKRFIKLFGLRVNLDEIEKLIENQFGAATACYGGDDSLKILIQSHDSGILEHVKRKVTDTYKIHHSVLFLNCIDAIPVTASGKKDYTLIQKMGY